MIAVMSHSIERLRRGATRSTVRWLAVAAIAVLGLAVQAPAFAGQASSGELLFYPCTSCHPVTLSSSGQPSRALPGEFKGHKIVLVGHDSLGKGDAACLVCHDDPGVDPGKLKLADGTLVDIRGDVAAVCYRCHSQKYKEWKAGTHGRHRDKCTASGCHDPHTPGFIYADPLMPFVGNGFQFKVLSKREAFTPLAPPAPDPAVDTPWWFALLGVVGLVAVGGIAGGLVVGSRKR